MPEEIEWKTRKERVDRKLKFLQPAWSIVKYRPGIDTAPLACHAVEEYPTHSGPADYALFVQGRFLGIIEAKKVGVGPAGVLEQAKRYARGAEDGPGNWRGYRVPFLYSTNGEIIHFFDIRAEKYLASSDGGLRQFQEGQRGATKVGLGLDDIKNVFVPLPPLDEQHEIVRRVEALFKIADDIAKRYQKAKAHVDKLTQSILAKAFRGELAPQDPNDEPATELLKRIQEERKNQKAEARPNRKSTSRRVKN
jgi:hypothetical protein